MITSAKYLQEAEIRYENINKNFKESIFKIIKDENIETVLLYPTGLFISKEYFVAWSDYRYGSRLLSLKIKSEFNVDNYFYIYNSRRFSYEKYPDDKIIIKYLKLLSSTSLGEILGWPLEILNDQKWKNICKEPYNNYYNENYIVIRQMLNINSDSSSIRKYRDILKSECNLNVSEIKKVQDKWSGIEYFWVNK